VARYVPGYAEEYRRRGWQMLQTLDRVYVNDRARAVLDWRPQFDFASAVACLRENRDYRSELTHVVGVKGYHADEFREGLYPVDA
jgi:UDP-glucose 4-epimerase